MHLDTFANPQLVIHCRCGYTSARGGLPLVGLQKCPKLVGCSGQGDRAGCDNECFSLRNALVLPSHFRSSCLPLNAASKSDRRRRRNHVCVGTGTSTSIWICHHDCSLQKTRRPRVSALMHMHTFLNVLHFEQFLIWSIIFKFVGWCKCTFWVLRRDKLWLRFKLRFGDLKFVKFAKSVLKLLILIRVSAACRWWDASPGVVVQHLDLSMSSTAGIQHSFLPKGAGSEKSLRIRGQTLPSKVEADPSRSAGPRQDAEITKCTWARKHATSIHGGCLLPRWNSNFKPSKEKSFEGLS